MEKLYYDYTTFKNDTRALLRKLDKEYDAVVAVARGGLTLAQAIAQALDIRNVQIVSTKLYDHDKRRETITIEDYTKLEDAKTILLVDDIADSGETLQALVSHLHRKHPLLTIETATLFYKHTSIYEPTYWVKETNEWIEFWWEKDFILSLF